MRLTTTLKRSLVGLAALLIAACGGSSAGPTTPSADVGRGNLQGAGATFPEPFYTKAFFQYSAKNPQVTVNYQAIGSGGGIKQFTAGTVDFGASDVPMTADEFTAAGGDAALIQVPTILGVVSIAYNLPGVSRVQIDGPTLADIFLGKVKKWDDPALKALNPGVTLPS